MKIPPFLDKLISGGAATLVDSIGNAIDKNVTNKEEREVLKQEMLKEVNRNSERLIELGNSELELHLKDTASARDANARIQESDKASWLAKNVAYCIDLFLAVLWGLVTIILLLKAFKVAGHDVDMVSLMALHGTVTAVFMTVVNFHRGTSRSSEDKQKYIYENKK